MWALSIPSLRGECRAGGAQVVGTAQFESLHKWLSFNVTDVKLGLGWEITVVSVRFYLENDAIYKMDTKFPRRTTTKGKFINHLDLR